MVRRLELHELLCTILGSQNVYFQPPPSIQMKFPCIIYSLSKISTNYADNLGYHRRDGYELMVVDRNPDSLIPDKLGVLELVSFNRHFIADNLHHFVYLLYF